MQHVAGRKPPKSCTDFVQVRPAGGAQKCGTRQIILKYSSKTTI
jgi:hypothetical protein